MQIIKSQLVSHYLSCKSLASMFPCVNEFNMGKSREEKLYLQPRVSITRANASRIPFTDTSELNPGERFFFIYSRR